MAVRMKPASSDEVREWANDNDWTDQYDRPVSDRGRLPTSLISDFNAAMRKHRIEYSPVARGEAQPPRSDDENRGRRSASTAVATRRDSAPASRSRKSEKTEVEPTPRRARREPIRVHADRGDAKVAPAPRTEVVTPPAVPANADAFEQMVQAMAAAHTGKTKGQPVLLASYSLTYV